MKALAWTCAVLMLAVLGLVAFRTFAVPLIREEAKRSLHEKETVKTQVYVTMRDETFSKECDAAMPQSSKQLEPFFSAYQRDGTYSVFLVEVPRKLVWRYDCHRVGGIAVMADPVVHQSTNPTS
jgi:hypothetical protein